MGVCRMEGWVRKGGQKGMKGMIKEEEGIQKRKGVTERKIKATKWKVCVGEK